MLKVELIRNYNTERGFLGHDEQSFLAEVGPSDVVGEGGETVVFRPRNEPGIVYKAFRDRDKTWIPRGSMSSDERADALVYAGEIGIGPKAERVGSLRIVKQPYRHGINRASIKNSLLSGDDRAVERTLKELKRYHDQGKTPGDANLTNITDPSVVGYITFDGTKARADGKPGEYRSRDLDKLYREAEFYDVGNTFLKGVDKVYGAGVLEKLKEAA